MKRYLVKYALSDRVKIIEGKPCGYNPSYFNAHGYFCNFKDGTECTVFREQAIARVDEMRTKKIASLEKQIAKLRKLDAAALVAKAEENRE